MTGPATLGLVDTHAHLDDDRLRGDLPAVLRQARELGVAQIIGIGTTASSSAAIVEIASQHPGVFAAVGIQPNHVAEAQEGDWDRVQNLAQKPRVVAIGETGLDRYWDRAPFPLQQEWFDRHLELAAATALPVVIHCRNCERDVIQQLEGWGTPVRGVLHSFTGSGDDADALLALGLHLSFAGMVTFANKGLDALRGVAQRIPLDRLLVETDSPYLSPHPLRGRRNEPAHILWTVRKLAEIRGLEVAELAQATARNAQNLFRLPPEEQI